jgi:hypothetical protein
MQCRDSLKISIPLHFQDLEIHLFLEDIWYRFCHIKINVIIKSERNLKPLMNFYNKCSGRLKAIRENGTPSILQNVYDKKNLLNLKYRITLPDRR